MSDTKCRVLCIDDHEDSAEMLRAVLSHEHFDVMIATSVQEGLRLAQRETFDLYVLDKHLVDGSGLELMQQLRDITPGVPCIFYSGDAYEIHRREALAAGANAYVPKPDIDGLIDMVHALLSKSACATA